MGVCAMKEHSVKCRTSLIVLLELLGGRQIRLGQHNQAMSNIEQATDIEMLPRLRLYRFIGGHNKQHRFDTSCTSEHVANKTLVSRDIDKAQALAGWQRKMREAQIDGNASPLLLGEPVRVNTRQRTDKRSLAMIDVARCPDNKSRGHEIV